MSVFTVVSTGCALRGDERSPTLEVDRALKSANVAHVAVEQCDFQMDPDESEFSRYRCTLVAGPKGAVLPLTEDRLPPGRSTYCFDIPRLPHGRHVDPIDLDAYPAFFPRNGSCTS